MRKIITILLLFIIFCSELGYYFFYILQQYQIKHQVKKELLALIPAASLEIIDLDKNIHLIKWEDDGKEFYLNGELYDIQKKVIENGKTLLYCLNDVQEEQLLKDFNKAAQRNNHTNKSIIKLTVDYYLTDTPPKISAPSTCLRQYFVYFNEGGLSATKEITVPPPKV